MEATVYPFSAGMDRPNDVVNARLERFKADLTCLSDQDIVGKHILSGDCYILSHEHEFNLCSTVAKQFKVRAERVYVVGSAKLGFSIAANKRYHPFHVKSDIDLAIVSPEFFDTIWMEVVRFDDQRINWPDQKRLFRKYLMNGWIRPDALPPADLFPRTRDWWRFFTQLTANLLEGRFKVNAGLYRTEDFLELYQVRSVASCKAEVELTR